MLDVDKLHADETFITFSYKLAEQATERRTNNRKLREKAPAVERNLDGTVKV